MHKIRENFGIEIGGKSYFNSDNIAIIAGPCSIESREHIFEIGKKIKAFGGDVLRGGTFKMRTSPRDFQGFGKESIKWLTDASKKIGIPSVSEIVDIRHLEFYEDVDILQVGARNMQNYYLLKELGKVKKPIILKRGFANTYKEVLFATEYILEGGNDKIIICERGIRTFEDYTRNTLDLASICAFKELSNFPIIVDPSHGTGRRSFVESMSMGAAAVGTDALMLEVHEEPDKALSDGMQSIDLNTFKKIVHGAKKIKKVLKEELEE